MDKLTELKRLAEAVIEGKDAFMRLPRAERLEGVPSWWRDHRAYADAMSPQTALSLIAQIEHLTAEREKDREALQRINDTGAEQDGALGRILRMQIIARARLEDTHD